MGGSMGIFRAYVYDRKRRRTRLVAPDLVGKGFDYAYAASVSGDGRRIGFFAITGRNKTGGLAFDRRSEKTVSAGEEAPVLSRNGRFAASILTRQITVNGKRVNNEQVVRFDLKTGRRQTVSKEIPQPGSDPAPRAAFDAAISANGRAISFTGAADRDTREANNLVYLTRLRR